MKTMGVVLGSVAPDGDSCMDCCCHCHLLLLLMPPALHGLTIWNAEVLLKIARLKLVHPEKDLSCFLPHPIVYDLMQNGVFVLFHQHLED